MRRYVSLLVFAALLGGCGGSAVDFGEDFDRDWVDENIDVLWEADIRGSGWGLGLTTGERTVCTVSSDAIIHVFALDDGRQLSYHELEEEEAVSAAICDGRRAFVVFADGSALMLAIGEESAERWRVNLGRSLLGEPLFVDENIIVFGANGTIEAWSVNSGLLLWEHTQQVSGISLNGFFRPLPVREKIYAGMPSGDFLAIAADTGVVVWKAKLHDLVDPEDARNLSHIASAGTDGDSVCAAAFRGWLACFNADSGDQEWQQEISSGGAVVVTENEVFAIDDAGTLHAFASSSGSELWQTLSVSAMRTPLLAAASGSLVVADGFGGISAYDPASGQRTGGLRLDSDPVALNVLAGGDLLVQTEEGILYRLRARQQ